MGLHLPSQVLVLAGGAGSRFHPYTEIIPKPMIPIGVNERPVLELIVRWLSKQGVKNFVFLVDYKWKYIYNYFEDGTRLGVKIKYSLDERNGYSGTGGAILKAYRSGLVDNTSLIWYGDILAPLDVRDLMEYHTDRKADATLVVSSKYQVPVGVVKMDNLGRVIHMAEKPAIDLPVTIGVAVVEKVVFEERIEENLGKSFDFMGDLIPWLISKNYKVYAYVYDGPWFDVGSLEKYKKLDINGLAIFEK